MSQSIRQLGSLLQAVPWAVMGVAADGRIAVANTSAERLFGYGPDDLVGGQVALLIPAAHAAIQDAHRCHSDDAGPTPAAGGMELAARRADSSEFPVEVLLTAAVATDERALIMVVVRDLLDRQRAEARFRGLLETAPDAMVGVGEDGRIAFVNTQVERLFGYRREELIGQPVEILVPEPNRPVHPQHRRRYLTDPKPRPMGAGTELAARRKDGSEFPAEISLSAIETGDGALVSAAIRDVTERRRAAEAQTWLASIVQSSQDAIIGWTLDGVITSWNPGAERLYGYSAREMIGQPADLLSPPERRPEDAEILRRTTAGERVEQYHTERL